MPRSNLEIMELAALLAGPSDTPEGISLEYEDIVRLVVSLAGAITQLPVAQAIAQNERVAVMAPDQVTAENLAEVQERLGRDRRMLEAAQGLKDVSIEIVASSYARRHWAGL
jgi:hypothetical protein